MRTTYMPKGNSVQRQWYIVDAAEKTLGRLASEVASIIRGKHKPDFTPNADNGDFVVIINAEKIQLTGKKLTQKMYYRHSGYPGGLKTMSAGDMIKKKPERIIELAVHGMLPKNRLGNSIKTRLKVYAGAEHPHQAQQPEVWELRG